MALLLGNNTNTNHTDHGDITAISGASVLTLMYWTQHEVAVATAGIEKLPMSFFEMSGDTTLVTKQVSAWTLSTVDPVPLGVWFHQAFVFDGSLAAADRVILYGNALPLTLTGSTPGTTLPDTSGNGLQVGQSNVSGWAAHVRLWTAALTQAEVAREMNRYWAARHTNLLMDCPFDDQLNARDYSQHGNHGTWNPASGTPVQVSGPPVSYGGKILVTG